MTDQPIYIWGRRAPDNRWAPVVRPQHLVSRADAERVCDRYRAAPRWAGTEFAVASGSYGPDRDPHVVTDEGWIGPLWRLLSDNCTNGADMSPEERAEIAEAILAGHAYSGGGGAAAEFTISPTERGA